MNKRKPLISIVTVTYNAEEFLEKTIQSVIEQTYDNIEYIIVDGASSDGTLKIIQKYNKNITYWVSEKDEGIYYAMNKAIDLSCGEWINFMNAGDTFVDTDSVRKVVTQVSPDIDIICGGINVIDSSTSCYEGPSPLSMIKERFPCNHQAMFTRVDVIKKYKFNTFYKIASDADLMLKLYNHHHLFSFIDEAIVNYLKDGYWNDNFERAHIELLYISSQYPNKHILGHTSFIALLEHNKEYNKEYKKSIIHSFIFKLDDLKVKYKDIAIYGNGLVGRMILDYLKNNVTVTLDKYQYNSSSVVNIEDVLNYQFDIIVITVFGKENEIENDLLTLGVKSEKIIRLI